MIEHNLELQFRMNDIEDNKTFDGNCAKTGEDVRIEARIQEEGYEKQDAFIKMFNQVCVLN